MNPFDTPPPNPPGKNGGTITMVIAAALVLCISMIGICGYAKLRLDRAQTMISDSSSGYLSDGDITDKLRRSLGYGGVLGAAQNFIATHDKSLLTDMRQNMKAANDLIARLPEKTPADVRREIQAIANSFDTTVKLAERSSTDEAVPFTLPDLTPLYAAIPVLESRLDAAAASGRFDAITDADHWGMILTVVCWFSLIIACGMGILMYITYLNRQSAPMRALVQSVRNMASGDMRTPIWGMERQDIVGEVARAVDKARFHFTQIPDVTIMTDQGPMRLKFEGESHSLFNAMMASIEKEAKRLKDQTDQTMTMTQGQNDILGLLTTRVEAILHNVEKRGIDGDKQVKDVIQTIVTTTQNLVRAQERGIEHLNKIVPFMQERAQGLSEITSLAGKQVAQSLQSLSLSDHALKKCAEESTQSIIKFNATADDLSQRLFGAVNLLQASGKVLSETTETTQSRLNEAIAKLDARFSGHDPLATATMDETTGIALASNSDVGLILQPEVEKIMLALSSVEERIGSLVNAYTQTVQNNLETTIQKLQAEHQTAAQSAHDILSRLEELNTSFTEHAQQRPLNPLEASSDNQQQEEDIIRVIGESYAELHKSLADTNATLASLQQSITSLTESPATEDTPTALEDDTIHVIGQSYAELHKSLAESNNTLAELKQSMTEHFSKPITVDYQQPDLSPLFADQTTRLQSAIERATVMQETDHLALRELIRQSTKDAAQTAAISAAQSVTGQMTISLAPLRDHLDQLARSVLELHTAATTQGHTEQLRDYWLQTAGQIEATRFNLEQTLIRHLEKKTDHSAPGNDEGFAGFSAQIQQQTGILTELVAALALLDKHMQDIQRRLDRGNVA